MTRRILKEIVRPALVLISKCLRNGVVRRSGFLLIVSLPDELTRKHGGDACSSPPRPWCTSQLKGALQHVVFLLLSSAISTAG